MLLKTVRNAFIFLLRSKALPHHNQMFLLLSAIIAVWLQNPSGVIFIAGISCGIFLRCIFFAIRLLLDV